jgi:hypothetical protein
MEEQRRRTTAARAATIRTRWCGLFMARGAGERAGRFVPLAKSARSAWFIHRAFLGTLLAVLSFAAGHAGKSEPYIWTNVNWGGGGYVTGIVAHLSAPNLLYIRTDVGGCYRCRKAPFVSLELGASRAQWHSRDASRFCAMNAIEIGGDQLSSNPLTTPASRQVACRQRWLAASR